MPCLAPSEAVITPTAKAFGLLAEDFIGEEYLRDRGRSTFFPASVEDFQDISVIFGNRQMHVAFLTANNPSRFTPGAQSGASTQAVNANRMRVPDLLNHIPGVSVNPTRAEYYEIKPNSISGRAAGRAKLRSLESDYTQLQFPYVRGKVWAPDKKIRILRGKVFGFEVEASFHYFLKQEGLIVYEICIEGPLLRALALALIIGIVAAIIIIIINRGKIPDIPPPRPPELPAPRPSPFPKPAPPVPVPVPIPGERSSFRDVAPPAGAGFVARLVPTIPMLGGSVGAGGTNRSEDVRVVQLLLNDWLGQTGQQLLAVDGKVGPKTIQGILNFQRPHTPFRDGRVDPAGPTLAALIGAHLGSLFRCVLPNPLVYTRGQRWLQAVPPTPATAFNDYLDALRGRMGLSFDDTAGH